MSRVLLVDDDLDLLESLEMLLGTRYVIRSAVDGHEALKLLDEEPADVAVVDLIMPRMDGEALISAMRARGFMAPVILASATPELVERARELGVFASLRKPFRLQALQRCLDAALQQGGGSNQSSQSKGEEPPGDEPSTKDTRGAGVTGDAPGGNTSNIKGKPSGPSRAATSSWAVVAEAARSWTCPHPSRRSWRPALLRP